MQTNVIFFFKICATICTNHFPSAFLIISNYQLGKLTTSLLNVRNRNIQSGPKKCIHSLLINIFGINRSPDLTLLDLYLWGSLKDDVSEETSYTGWSRENIAMLCVAITLATSTVFGCRWWPLRTPTLNPKFKDISHINFAFV
jgi:hypothetical protein